MQFKHSVIALGLLAALSGCALEGDDGEPGAQGPAGQQGPAGEQGPSGEDGQGLPRELNIEVVGRFATGVFGKSAAEIVQFHQGSAPRPLPLMPPQIRLR